MTEVSGRVEISIPDLNDGLSIQQQPHDGNHPDEVVRFDTLPEPEVIVRPLR
jgi:hypothetical protein